MRGFHIATPEQIKSGAVTDIYFQRSAAILDAMGVDARVRAEFMAKSLPDHWEWAVFAGLAEAAHLLEGINVNVRAMEEGAIFRPHEPVIEIEGSYREFGKPFQWLYEFTFIPLTATMFSMLAFFVASAAFRAFRAKNFEAFLLLGTAFIILLGRTFAGVFLTGWLPDALAGLRIENLTVDIMRVFNTAGNRAIMIGIALGIVSTSLKVILGVDRSYLGSGEE